jgi:NTP pyrophosphatase (non-canonical NTP hydrolase)
VYLVNMHQSYPNEQITIDRQMPRFDWFDDECNQPEYNSNQRKPDMSKKHKPNTVNVMRPALPVNEPTGPGPGPEKPKTGIASLPQENAAEGPELPDISAAYANVVRNCCRHHEGSRTAALVDVALGIATESGEVNGEIKKALSFNDQFDELAIKMEIGDLLFSIAALLNLLDSSFNEVFALNIEKVTTKHNKLTSKLQERMRSDENEMEISPVTVKKRQIAETALRLAIGRASGVPYDEVGESLIQSHYDEAASYIKAGVMPKSPSNQTKG